MKFGGHPASRLLPVCRQSRSKVLRKTFLVDAASGNRLEDLAKLDVHGIVSDSYFKARDLRENCYQSASCGN